MPNAGIVAASQPRHQIMHARGCVQTMTWSRMAVPLEACKFHPACGKISQIIIEPPSNAPRPDPSPTATVRCVGKFLLALSFTGFEPQDVPEVQKRVKLVRGSKFEK
jgi:hypothetical protein